MNEMKFCQSCAMPLSDEAYGTEKNGSKSADYCSHCYQNGAFVGEMTMEEMIEFCLPFTAKSFPDKSEAEVRAQMESFFPQLKRWAKAQ